MSQTCRNCGNIGHLFKDCPHPITSYGIIVYRETNMGLEYLMIQRKDSLSFMEFIRGKYDTRNVIYILTLLNGMTQCERELLQTKTFKELWDHLWCQPNIKQHSEYNSAKSKFDLVSKGYNYENRYINLKILIQCSITNYIEPEWGFPKGRKRMKEEDVDCAVREFCEETNFKPEDITINTDLPFEEVFYGTNNILYKHVYYLAKMTKKQSNVIAIDPDNINQAREVRAVQWFKFDEVLSHIRDHNQERKRLFLEVHEKLKVV